MRCVRGALLLSALHTVAGNTLATGGTLSGAREFIKESDKDQNGKLSREELKTAAGDLLRKYPDGEQLLMRMTQRHFTEADENGDHMLDASEILQLERLFYEKEDMGRAEKLMDELDLDLDGLVTRLEVKEAMKADDQKPLEKHGEYATLRVMDRHFSDADKNKDRALDVYEILDFEASLEKHEFSATPNFELEEAHKFIQEHDKDSDEKLSREELHDAADSEIKAHDDGALMMRILQRHFPEADKDSDGLLDADEVLALGKLYEEREDKAKADKLLDDLDMDGNGALSTDEIRDGLARTHVSHILGETEFKQLIIHFSESDLNGDKMLDQNELADFERKVIESQNSKRMDAFGAKDFVGMSDKNGDGKLSTEELKSALKGEFGRLPDVDALLIRVTQRHFHDADKDGDFLLSPDEVLHLEQRLKESEAVFRAEKVMDDLDQDLDGLVTLPELQEALTARKTNKYFGEEEFQRLRKHFSLADKDGNKGLDISEILEFEEKIAASPQREPDSGVLQGAAEFIKQNDKDRDGKISKKELSNAMQDVLNHPDGAALMMRMTQRHFPEADRDHDGLLDAQEFHSLEKAFEEKEGMVEAEKLMDDLDKDMDGLVTKDEVRLALQDHRAGKYFGEHEFQKIDEHFMGADKNRDNALDVYEIQDFEAKMAAVKSKTEDDIVAGNFALLEAEKFVKANDKDQDGKLSKDEVKAGLHADLANLPDGDALLIRITQRHFPLADKDHDGRLDAQEVLELEKAFSKENLGKAEKVMDDLDADADGLVSRKEVRAALESQHSARFFGEEEFRKIDAHFTEADKNKDGFLDTNEILEFEEEAANMKMSPKDEQLGLQDAHGFIKKNDKDRDFKISREELLAQLQGDLMDTEEGDVLMLRITQRHFPEADKDGDGLLGVEEVMHLQAMLQEREGLGKAEKLMDDLDKNLDGKVTKMELREALTNHHDSRYFGEYEFTKVDVHFWEADKNRDHALDVNELFDLEVKLSKMKTWRVAQAGTDLKAKAAAFIGAGDKDDDGRLNRKEVMNALQDEMLKHPGGQAALMRTTQRHFIEADKDHDGLLDKAEVFELQKMLEEREDIGAAEKLMDLMDTDLDGVASKGEVRAAAKYAFADIETLKNQFADADANRDGFLDVYEILHFEQAMDDKKEL